MKKLLLGTATIILWAGCAHSPFHDPSKTYSCLVYSERAMQMQVSDEGDSLEDVEKRAMITYLNLASNLGLTIINPKAICEEIK